MKWIKNNALAISIVFLVVGIALIFHSNQYEISSKVISSIQDGKIIKTTIHELENISPLLSILSNVFMSLGIALFISAFFIRHLEGEERQEFEQKLLSFQENTAKDAIESVFKRIIDEEFFNIIKKNLLNAKSIRKNANWQYDITENSEGILQLKRTISYEFHNVSHTKATELIRLKSNNNEHCCTDVISGKIRHPSGTETPIELTTTDGGTFTALEQEIHIEAGESIEVVLVFQQTFKSGYIYESHSSRYPIIGLEITVNYPEGYVFDLFSSFSNKERLRINEPDKKVYVVKGAIFTGQGVEFFCEKEKKT